MPITLNGDTGIQTPMYNGTITANAVTPSVNMKNRIINGAMTIDQRNAGASITATTGTIYGVDRFFVQGSVTSKFTAQQSTTAPAGFINSWLLTSSAATTPSSSDYYYFAQSIEGLNCTDLAWGTANAKAITISFWVRSSLTGTFSGAVLNSASDRSYAFTFTINSANTFEYKTVTIAGDTSGTWLTTNGIGLVVRFALGAGSSFLQSAGSWGTGNVVGATGTTQWISTSGATFYITGVQLEVGSTATSFDYRPYGTELLLCQRYYQLYQGIIAYSSPNYNYQLFSGYPFPVPMRTTPSIGQTGLFSFDLPGSYTRTQSSASIAINVATQTGAAYVIGNFSSLSTNQVHSQSSSNSITFSAEL